MWEETIILYFVGVLISAFICGVVEQNKPVTDDAFLKGCLAWPLILMHMAGQIWFTICDYFKNQDREPL